MNEVRFIGTIGGFGGGSSGGPVHGYCTGVRLIDHPPDLVRVVALRKDGHASTVFMDINKAAIPAFIAELERFHKGAKP